MPVLLLLTLLGGAMLPTQAAINAKLGQTVGGTIWANTACGDRLFHTHISESHRGTLGSGTVDWAAVFGALKAIGYQGRLSVEAFATDVQPLATSAHVWRDTFRSKDQLATDAFAFLRQHWA